MNKAERTIARPNENTEKYKAAFLLIFPDGKGLSGWLILSVSTSTMSLITLPPEITRNTQTEAIATVTSLGVRSIPSAMIAETTVPTMPMIPLTGLIILTQLFICRGIKVCLLFYCDLLLSGRRHLPRFERI